MKVAAAVYTLASVVVLTLMVMRPPVNITSPAQEAANAPAAADVAMPVTMPAVAPTADTALTSTPPAPAVAPAPMVEPAPAAIVPPPAAAPMPAAPTAPVPAPSEQNPLEEKKNYAGFYFEMNINFFIFSFYFQVGLTKDSKSLVNN